MAKTTYLALTPVVHNGELFGEGESLTLEDKHAQPLLALHAIAVKPNKVPAAPPAGEVPPPPPAA